jgi:hypothetical protein
MSPESSVCLTNNQPLILLSLAIGNMFLISLYRTPLLHQDVLVMSLSMDYLRHHDLLAPLLPVFQWAGLANLANEAADLRGRVSSKAVTIDNFTFASFSKNVDWATYNFPSDPCQARVCLDAPTLLRSIRKEFSINQDTREALYQNKKAGISKFALTPASVLF